jgi:hypothetical protein
MTDPRMADHMVGIELQIIDLVERRERAEVQGDAAEASRYQSEIDDLQRELAVTAEHLIAS